MVKSFRQFMEEASKTPLVSSLEDILGIDAEDLKKEPQLGTFFKISQGTNMGSYKIVEFKRDSEGRITHALIEPLHMDKVYGGTKGSQKRLSKGKMDSRPRLVAIKDLDGLLGQDFAANQPAL